MSDKRTGKKKKQDPALAARPVEEGTRTVSQLTQPAAKKKHRK